MPIASNLVSQQVKNLTGSDALANASKNLIKDGTNELTSGSGKSTSEKFNRSGCFSWC